MLHSVRWSRCALALAIGSFVLFDRGPASAAGYNRAPAQRGVPMTTGYRSQQASPEYVGDLPDSHAPFSVKPCGCESCGMNQCGSMAGCCGSCGDCYGGCDSACCDMYGCYPPPCPPCGPRLAAWVDSLYLRATGADVVHAQQQDGLTTPGDGDSSSVPFGEIGSVGLDYDHGVRVGAAIGCDGCSSIQVSWSYFDTDSFDRVSPRPPTIELVDAVGSLVQHPGAATLASLGPVDAIYAVEFQLADVMYNRAMLMGNGYCVGAQVGVQYGHLEQDFAQIAQFAQSIGPTVTATTIEFDGAGLKGGFDAEGQLGRNVSVYGRMTGAAMTGRFHSNYLMYNAELGSVSARANWTDNRIVPQLEYELGIACTFCDGCLRLSTGYMFSHWFNVITTPEFIRAVQSDQYVDVGDTLSFDGAVTRLEARW